MIYEQPAEPRRSRCLFSCIEVVDPEQQQGRFVSVAGGPATSPWFAEQVVEVRRPELQERIIEVPRIANREKIVEEKRQIIREKLRYVPRYETVERVTHVPKHLTKEVITDVPQVQVVERTVEVPTTVYQDVVVPIAKPVVEERTTHVPKPVLVEKVIEVPRIVHRPYPVEKIVEVPQTKIEYRYRDVPVTQKVPRPVAPPVQQSYQVVEEKVTRPPAIRWRQQSSPVPTLSIPSPRPVVSACCAPPYRRAATQEIRYQTFTESPRSHVVPPTQWHTAPLKEETKHYQQQPFVVEGVELAAEEAACCPLTPKRQQRMRGELQFAPRGSPGKQYNVRITTLPSRRGERRLCDLCCDFTPKTMPRAASVPPRTMTVHAIAPPMPYSSPPPFAPMPVPVYHHYQQQNAATKQQQQLQLGATTEPWIRTKMGDMPFAEFERLNNENSLASSPRPTAVSMGAYTSHPHQQRVFLEKQPFTAQREKGQEGEERRNLRIQGQSEQQKQQQAEEARLLLERQQQREEEVRGQLQLQQQREEERRRLLQLQQQRERESRRLNEQQEQQRQKQLQQLEQARQEAESRRQQELQQLHLQLQMQREQQERELQQSREEEQRKIEEERQKWLTQMQQEREHTERLQRQRQQKELEELMQIQQRQQQEQEERQQRFMKEQEEAMAQLLQKQQQQQELLQRELKEHHERLRQHQELLRIQQEQALRQLQDNHLQQQQRLWEETQRRSEAVWRQAATGPATLSSTLQPSVVQEGPSEVLIQTRFGLMPYSAFQSLNQENALSGVATGQVVETSTYLSTTGSNSASAWGTEVPATTTVYTHPSPPRARNVVYRTSYPAQHEYLPPQQHYYTQPAQTYWVAESQNQCLLPSGEEAENIKTAAQKIGQDAAMAGSQVYGGVKSAVNSEVTQDIFRSVGEFVSDAYQRMRPRRQ